MNEHLNCPNCGAPITGATCEYCGSVFFDFANLELYKESYLRMKINDTLNIFKAVTEAVTVEPSDGGYETYYFDNEPIRIAKNPEYKLTIEMKIVPDDKGILLERRNKKIFKEK